MSDQFNPHYEWLGIPPKHQPADHYRLLGIERFEADPVVIEHAAEQRLTFLRTKQTGRRGKLADQLLNEISRAKATLINANTKTKYDQALQNTLLKTAESTSSPGPHRSASAPTDRTADRLRGRGRNGARKSPGRSSAASLLRFGLVAIVAIIAIAYGFYRWQQAAEQQRRQQAEIAQLKQRQNTEKNAKETSVKNETAAREEAEADRKEEAERKAKEEAAAVKRRKEKEEAERKAKEEEEAKKKAEQEAERKAKEEEAEAAEAAEAERKAKEEEEEEKQRQKTLQWRKAHFTQQKNGAWQPNLSEQWGRELKQAKKTGSSVSKDGKQFKKREKEINTLMASVAAAKGALDAHNKTPILNNAVRPQWFREQARLKKRWQENTVLLNRKWRSFWITAERFIKSLDNLEQEHPKCEATFTKMRQLYKHPKMNRAKQIEPDANFSSLKENKKKTDLRALQGIIDNAQPTRKILIALYNHYQKLNAAP